MIPLRSRKPQRRLPRLTGAMWLMMTVMGLPGGAGMVAQEITPLREMGRRTPGFIAPADSNAHYHEVPLISRESALWMDSAPGKFSSDYGWSEEDMTYIAERRMLRFDIGGRANVGYSYNDNLFLGESGDEVQGVSSSDISLVASVSYGPNSWGLSSFLSYNPMFQYFWDSLTSPQTGETIDHSMNHSVFWNTAWSGSRMRANLDLSYISMDGANIEIGQWVSQNTAQGTFSLGYDYSPKTTLGASLGTQLMDLSGTFLNQNNYVASLFATYQILPKVRIGPQVSYSYWEVDGSSNTTALNYSVLVSWAATSKMTIGASMGFDDREYSAGESTVTPTFSLDINYNPFTDGRTSFGINTYRRYSPSVALVNQGFYATGVAATLTRQIGTRTSFQLAGGYEFTEYEAMATGTFASRQDDILFLRSGLTYAFNHRFSVTAYYQLTENDSTGFGAASFTRNQYGIMLTAAF